MSNDTTKAEAPDHVPAVHEEPAASAPGAAVPAPPVPSITSGTPGTPDSPGSPGSPDVAETSEPPTREDVRRFRLAALRARLALLGVAFDPSTDEATLRRMLRAAEGPTGPEMAEGAEPAGDAEQVDTATPPSAEMRRATARHLRERQRAAVEDRTRKGGRPRGGGRS